jgi:hypothetical protein
MNGKRSLRISVWDVPPPGAQHAGRPGDSFWPRLACLPVAWWVRPVYTTFVDRKLPWWVSFWVVRIE